MPTGLVRRRQGRNVTSTTNSLTSSAELGSVFYSVKEKNFDGRGNRRTADREFSKKAELETQMAKQREE